MLEKNDPLQDLLDAELARKPEPHEMVSSFDCGTWAAMRGLLKVLQSRGVLDNASIGGLLDEMERAKQEYVDRGETQRAEAVAEAITDVMTLTSEHMV